MKFMVVLLGTLWLSYELQLGCCLNCNGNQYTVVDSSGADKECQNCGDCHPGTGRHPICGTRVKEPVMSDCLPCAAGNFSDKEDTAPCKRCHQCVTHEIVTSPCTNKSDTVCNGTCDHGYYFLTKKAPHNCQECSHCCNDGKDEIQQECVKQGLNDSNQHCSVRQNKHCGPTATTVTTDALPPSGTQASGGGGSKPLAIGLSVPAGVGLLIAIVAVCYMYVQWRKKKKATTSTDANNALMNVEGPASDNSRGASPHIEIGLDLPTNHQTAGRGVNLAYAGSNPSTPQIERSLLIPNATGSSRDSQSSRVPEIEVHPLTQTKQEGTQVVFSCKVKGDKEVLYQWLKDDKDLPMKCSPSLVLDSVKLHDFGSYTCSVKYENFEAVITSPTELNVSPRQGMRYKLLKDLDQTTEENICGLLGNKAYGVGGYQHVADKYGMESAKRRSLERNPRPVKDVLEYLNATHPDLTVYEFCKTLKGEHIKRLDVVGELLNHLTVKEESAEKN